MKGKVIIAAMALVSFSALADEGQYLSDFASAKSTSKSYSQLISKNKLPAWVKSGGTSTPSTEVTVAGKKYIALSGCKPHSCPEQNIAVLYSPDNGDIHGVFSDFNAEKNQETLTWLNVDPIDSDAMKNALFNRLYGN